MKFLLFSVLLMFMGCKSHYATLRPYAASRDCLIAHNVEDFETSWFNTSIDVYGKHLSGLLLIKRMEKGLYRTVFTSETGTTFFDFELASDGGFTVKRIIKQMDKKAVVETLKKDFKLLLGMSFRGAPASTSARGDEIFYAFPQKRETAYFITDKDCASLRRLELGSDRKRKVSIVIDGTRTHPYSITIDHHTFDMTINLKRIERE